MMLVKGGEERGKKRRGKGKGAKQKREMDLAKHFWDEGKKRGLSQAAIAFSRYVSFSHPEPLFRCRLRAEG